MVVLYMDKDSASQLLCQALELGIPDGRFVWLVMGTDIAAMLQTRSIPCDFTHLTQVFYFHVKTIFEYGQVGLLCILYNPL